MREEARLLLVHVCMFMKAVRQSEPTRVKVNAIPLRTSRRREGDANYQGLHHVGEQMRHGDDGIESTCVRQDAFAAGHTRPFVTRGCV